MTDHIILAAFGTTTRAQESYHYLERRIAPRFPGCQTHLAFSSPTVRRRSVSSDSEQPASLAEVIGRLDNPGKVVIQSLHILPGYEYHRILKESSKLDAAVSVGKPLLHDPTDFTRVALCLKPLIENFEHDAVLLFAHGTTHPCRSAYHVLQRELRTQIEPNIYLANLEMHLEPVDVIIKKLVSAGHQRVLGIPFLMVAGMHFFRDINGSDESSWHSRLRRQGIDLQLHDQGLAMLAGIDAIICTHIEAALADPGELRP